MVLIWNLILFNPGKFCNFGIILIDWYEFGKSKILIAKNNSI